ncbi:hypothetical protein HDV01_002832 [Terramyces sp. JEL0728]|nr:hypothetical protein HDV01_002832 [Terramyces sp. JEL0728]
MLVTLEIPIKDPSYSWFLEWMTQNSKTKAPPKSFIDRAMAKNLHQLSIETTFTKYPNGSTKAEFSLVPGQGRHFFKYQHSWFQVERSRESKMVDITTGSPWETIKITTLSKDRNLFVQILEEAKTAALSKEIGKMVVFTSYGHEWRPFGLPRKRRPLSSVVLNGNTSAEILNDVKQFLEAEKWYNDRGIPYRRGYLLHGPPGTGKSSFIQSLAGELEYNICIMNLAELGMTDDRFAHLLNNIPPRSIILLEDIDAAFSDRTAAETAKQGHQGMLTLSGLLNGLDGVVASEERIIFMTTNHLDRLDPAIIRPGRVDTRIFIGNVAEEQARTMFLKFYEGENLLATKFVDELKTVGLIDITSPASLQGHFVQNKDSAQHALDNIEHLVPK